MSSTGDDPKKLPPDASGALKSTTGVVPEKSKVLPTTKTGLQPPASDDARLTRSRSGSSTAKGSKTNQPEVLVPDHTTSADDIQTPDSSDQEELSDEDTQQNVFFIDQELLDPEGDEEETTTLAFYFPKIQLTPADLMKDLNEKTLVPVTGLRFASQEDVDNCLGYYQDLCYFRRKIYKHNQRLTVLLKKGKVSLKDLRDIQVRLNNSKMYLEKVHAKLISLYVPTDGQNRSYKSHIKSFNRNVSFVADALDKAYREVIREEELKVANARLENQAAKQQIQAAQDQLDLLKQAQAAKDPSAATATGGATALPDSNMSNLYEPDGRANLTGHPFSFGAGRSRGNPSATFRGGQSRRGGLSELLRPPPDQDDDLLGVLRGIGDALRQNNSTRDRPTEPNYRGMERTKLDPFTGDAMDYKHWLNRFDIAIKDRNLPDDYLANMFYSLLKGDARRVVEVHFTADWSGNNYQKMRDQLKLEYGSRHVQDRCIEDKAAKIVPFDTLTMKACKEFYYGITVQVNYYQETQPHAIRDSNSPLFRQIRRKINDKIFAKYIEWLVSGNHEFGNERTLLTLQAWIESKISLLQEVEILSNSRQQRSSKSPIRNSVFYGSTDPEDKEYDDLEYDSDEDSEHTLMYLDNKNRRVSFNTNKQRYFKSRTFSPSNQTIHPASVSSGYRSTLRAVPKEFVANIDKNTSVCQVCKNTSHEIPDCPKFTALTQRQKYGIVMHSGACYHCLNRGHGMLMCPNNPKQLCGVDGCTKYEHPLIHPDSTTFSVHIADWSNIAHGTISTDTTGPIMTFTTTVMKLAREGVISVQTLVCTISNRPTRWYFRTVAMLDSGSNTTCIDEDVANKLKLKKRSNRTTKIVNTIEGQTEINSYLVEVYLASADGLTCQMILAQTVKNLTRNTSVADWSKFKHNFEHLKDIPFSPLPEFPSISLLIGSDNAHLFSAIEGTKREGARGEPIAYQTELGWTCLGPTTKPVEQDASDLYLTINSLMPKTK